MVDEPAAIRRKPAAPAGDTRTSADLDFVAPWDDGPAVIVDITGPEPRVTIRPAPRARPAPAQASFVAPWAADEELSA